MRGITLFALLFCLALSAQEQQESEPAAPPQRRGPSIERSSNGIVTIRGSSRRAPEPAPEAEAPAEDEQPNAAAGEEAAPGDDAAAESDAPQPADEKKPSAEEAQRYVYDASGRRRAAGASSQVSRTDGSESLALKLRNLNGREVPYLDDTTKVVSESAGLKVSERVTQRFGPDGRPAGQEMERIEERKLPGGAVETVTTSYAADLNGRMQPAERKVVREEDSNGVTRTVSTTERASMNGGFRPVLQEESTERKQGDQLATIEKVVKTASAGSRLAVTAREETTMRKQGAQLITETTRYERAPASSDLAPASRTVGKLVERPDGTSNETVETFAYGVPGGPTNLNASRMQLQKVVETRTTLGSDGSVQERRTTRERSIANPSEFASPVVSQKVSKPLPGGESVRTDTYETGVNGSMQAVESVIEKIEK